MLNASPEELADLSDALTDLSAEILCAGVAPLSANREFFVRQQLALIGCWCCDVAGEPLLIQVSPEEIKEVSDAGLVA